MLSTSMADNVISYKKIKRNTQKNKNADLQSDSDLDSIRNSCDVFCMKSHCQP